MRAPLSGMLPVRRGVSILMRGPAAIAVSRLTTGATAAAGVVAAVPDGAGVLPVCGAPPAGLAGCGVGVTVWLWAFSAARCFSICGMLNRYCQPISTRPDRMTARMVLRLSVIVQVSSFMRVRLQRRLRACRRLEESGHARSRRWRLGRYLGGLPVEAM